MSTIEPGALIPDGLAARLAGHYAPDATGTLARLHWTGEVGTPGDVGVMIDGWQVPDTDSRGRRDEDAAAAELRALAHYCLTHAGRRAVDDWRVWTPAKGDEAAMVVPWAWRWR